MTASRRRLILTRHAKSAWDDPAMEDHARPLNRRGIRAAQELGEWLHSRGYLPEEVLCSDARRTAETWAVVAGAPLEVLPRVEISHDLYLASADTLLARLRRVRAESTVMLIAHNPGIGELALRLPAEPPASAALRKFPTCATAVIDFYLDSWNALRPGEGSLLDMFLPSEHD